MASLRSYQPAASAAGQLPPGTEVLHQQPPPSIGSSLRGTPFVVPARPTGVRRHGKTAKEEIFTASTNLRRLWRPLAPIRPDSDPCRAGQQRFWGSPSSGYARIQAGQPVPLQLLQPAPGRCLWLAIRARAAVGAAGAAHGFACRAPVGRKPLQGAARPSAWRRASEHRAEGRSGPR